MPLSLLLILRFRNMKLKDGSYVSRPKDLLICSTNNGTERLNEDLKHDEHVGWKNCTLSELLTIVIESFLPELYEKYVELNTKFTSGYKKYQESIPESLHNRPRFIVQNMLEILSKVTSSMISSVKVLTEGRIFQVQSESVTSNLKAKYIVDFGNIHETCSWIAVGLDVTVLLVNIFLLSLMQGIEHLGNYLLFFWSIR